MHKKPTQTSYARQLLVWKTLGECHRYLREIKRNSAVHRVGEREISELSGRIEFALGNTGIELVDRIAESMERGDDADVPGADGTAVSL